MPLTLSGRNLLYIHGEVVAKFLRLRFTCPCPSFQFFRCTTVADRIKQDLCDSATRRGILLSVGRYQRSPGGAPRGLFGADLDPAHPDIHGPLLLQ